MRVLRNKYLFIVFLGLLVLGATQRQGHAQDADDLHIVQLSGLVMNADSTQTIPGVHIYDPYRGRGTNSDYKGWFSKAFLAGDTIIVSVIGYVNQRFVIPEDVGDRLSVIFALEEEVTQLADVEINPFPTEEIFKEAILAMNLTRDQQTVLNNSEPEIIRELMASTPLEATPSANYRYMQNLRLLEIQNSAGPRPNPLLNPFAWGQFIRSLKKKKR